MRKLLTFFALALSIGGYGQNQHSIGLSADYGFLFLHSQDLAPIGQSYPVAGNFNYSYWLLQEENWQDCHCFPRIGLSTGFHHYDNLSVLGVGVPLYGYLEPWYKLSDRLFFILRGGIGFTWLSRPYNTESNPLNLSYSLPVSIFANIGVGLGYQVAPQWRITSQIRYNHTSNGGFKEPNKGLNYPTGNIGLDYSFQAIDFKSGDKRPFNGEERKKSLRIHLFAAGKAGGKIGEGINEQEVTYLVSGAEVRYSHQIGRVSALMVGTEWINNLAYRKQIERRNLDKDHNQANLLLGHEFLLGNFVFSQIVGIYLYKDYDPTPDWYQRLGLLWYPFENWSVGGDIKVHGHVAEFIDLRIGYRLKL